MSHPFGEQIFVYDRIDEGVPRSMHGLNGINRHADIINGRLQGSKSVTPSGISLSNQFTLFRTGRDVPCADGAGRTFECMGKIKPLPGLFSPVQMIKHRARLDDEEIKDLALQGTIPQSLTRKMNEINRALE